jgi:hypothetical protein
MVTNPGAQVMRIHAFGYQIREIGKVEVLGSGLSM